MVRLLGAYIADDALIGRFARMEVYSSV